MKTSTIVWIIVVIIIVLGGGWYLYSVNQGGSQNPAEAPMQLYTPTTPAASSTSSTATPVLSSSSSASLGSYLVASNGMTLYKYAPDSAGVSNCTGQCAVSWPPYTVPAGTTLAAVSGITGQLGTLLRADGTTQVTYNGKPLYFYVKDAKPGDTTGQGIGGVWSVVNP